MTDDSRFFQFVWRFNGLVIMAAGIMALAVIAFTGYQIFQDMAKDKKARDIVNVQGDSDSKETWHLGYMTGIEGSPYVMIPLIADQGYSQSSYSESTQSARNYLFINSQNNEKYWLLNTNQYVIEDADLLSEKDYNSDNRDVRAILFRIVKADSNNDRRLTNDDLQSVALAMPDGKGYKEILSDIDWLIGSRLIDKDTLLIVFQRKGVGYSATVSLPGFVISDETELPKVGT